MLITKRSPFTGKENTMDIPVTQDQLDRYNNGSKSIQNAMPRLTPDQREFIMTGITPEEWNNTFKSN